MQIKAVSISDNDVTMNCRVLMWAMRQCQDLIDWVQTFLVSCLHLSGQSTHTNTGTETRDLQLEGFYFIYCSEWY